MTRTKIELKIGDKVKHAKVSKSEGVIVHHHTFSPDGKEWSVHWYNFSAERGIYTAADLKKYY